MAHETPQNMDHEEESAMFSEEEGDNVPFAVEADDNSDSDSHVGSYEEMESDGDEEICEVSEGSTKKVYLPSKNVEGDDVSLEYDESAYIFFRQATTVEPCLSFDVIRDNLGDDRADNFPLSMTIVCGTQAEYKDKNKLMVMKMSNINKHKTSNDSDEEESESEDEDEDYIPVLNSALIRHQGSVNRIRYTSFSGKPLAASWSEDRKVLLWDLTKLLRSVNDQDTATSHAQDIDGISPLFSFSGHLTEGYALDWSSVVPGVLATGDKNRHIHLWKPLEGGTWHVDQKALSAHTASVEDIQWSPNESNVMASCSCDKSIRIWDTRAPANKSCVLTTEDAHDGDVNVINWNKKEPFILSGGDDGKIKVWDIRRFLKGLPLCTFKHHTAPITSVEWHPKDSTVFAASGADDQLTLWDLAVETDFEQEGSEGISSEQLDVPPQLLFIHQGQKEIKEIHWHPQIPGALISTSLKGFDLFRTISV